MEEVLRPGTPQANCSLCANFDAQKQFCNALQIPTTPQMVSDNFMPAESGMSLEDMLFTGVPSGR